VMFFGVRRADAGEWTENQMRVKPDLDIPDYRREGGVNA